MLPRCYVWLHLVVSVRVHGSEFANREDTGTKGRMHVHERADHAAPAHVWTAKPLYGLAPLEAGARVGSLRLVRTGWESSAPVRIRLRELALPAATIAGPGERRP